MHSGHMFSPGSQDTVDSVKNKCSFLFACSVYTCIIHVHNYMGNMQPVTQCIVLYMYVDVKFTLKFNCSGRKNWSLPNSEVVSLNSIAHITHMDRRQYCMVVSQVPCSQLQVGMLHHVVLVLWWLENVSLFLFRKFCCTDWMLPNATHKVLCVRGIPPV